MSPAKVLFIGVFHDETGYCHAAIDQALALDAAGVDVVCRSVKLNNVKYTPPKRILELEAKPSAGSTHCIQSLLPIHFDFNGNFKKNIGTFFWETDRLSTRWVDRINCMDEVWVPSFHMQESCRRSGVKVPVRIVPQPADLSRFQQGYGILPELKSAKDDFLFYFIGEFQRRKNIASLLTAFHTEFGPNEPVNLVLKTGENEQQVRTFCDDIKKGLKLRDCKNEAVIARHLTDTEIMQVHASCDCYVSATHSEGWGMSEFTAMAMGRTPIVTDYGGISYFLTGTVGWPVPWNPVPCFGMDSFPDIYTGNESWAAISIPALRSAMREAYCRPELRKQKAMAGIERAYDFSLENVGAKMKELLDERTLA